MQKTTEQKRPEVQRKEALILIAEHQIKVNRQSKHINLDKYFNWKESNPILKAQILFLKYWYNFEIVYK